MTQYLRLSWDDFEEAVGVLAAGLKGVNARAVYGEPRGGLLLAVALSHRLGLPLCLEAQPNAIWVDDIVDSGRTRATATGAAFVAWFSRKPRSDTLVARVCTGNEWVVFPWEVEGAAAQDQLAYEASRVGQVEARA